MKIQHKSFDINQLLTYASNAAYTARKNAKKGLIDFSRCDFDPDNFQMSVCLPKPPTPPWKLFDGLWEKKNFMTVSRWIASDRIKQVTLQRECRETECGCIFQNRQARIALRFHGIDLSRHVRIDRCRHTCKNRHRQLCTAHWRPASIGLDRRSGIGLQPDRSRSAATPVSENKQISLKIFAFECERSDVKKS